MKLFYVVLLLTISTVFSQSCSELSNADSCNSDQYPDCAWCYATSQCLSNSSFSSQCFLCFSLNQTVCGTGNSCEWCPDLGFCLEACNPADDHIVNGNFESGTLSNWNAVSGDAWSDQSVVSFNAWKMSSTGLEGIFNRWGTFFASSFMNTRSNAATGVLQSNPFTIGPNSTLFYRLGGGNSPNIYMSIMNNQTNTEIIRIYSTTNSFFMQQDSISFNETQPVTVSIMIVDNDVNNSIDIDGFWLQTSEGIKTPIFSNKKNPEIGGYLITPTDQSVISDCSDLIAPVYCTYEEADAAATTCVTTRVATGYCAMCQCCYTINTALLSYSCSHYKWPICSECNEAVERITKAHTALQLYKKFSFAWAEAEFAKVLEDAETTAEICELLGVFGPEGTLVCDVLALPPEVVADIIVKGIVQNAATEFICKQISDLICGPM